MMSLTGLSAFPITPSDASGRVDVSGLRRLLMRLTAANVDSIGLLGSTGTYAYLSREERRRAVETAVEVVDGRCPILVGVGALRTDEAVRLAQDARAIGASLGLLAPVSYTPLLDDEVFEHFSTVLRESGLPLCIYDNPSTTHFRFSPALVARLSQLAGIVAVKSPATDASSTAAHLRELRALVPPTFSLGYSADWNSVEALIAGADVWYSVVGGVFPAECLSIVRAVQRGDAGEAQRLDAEMKPLWDLFKEFSSLRAVYAAVEVLGLCKAQPPRPILSLPDAARIRVEAVLRELRLIGSGADRAVA
jgi:4-hydroxy-tetrahydrodipicolinate synthase